jgi:hypothetical protein
MTWFEVDRVLWKLAPCVTASVLLTLWSTMRWVGVAILVGVEVSPEATETEYDVREGQGKDL